MNAKRVRQVAVEREGLRLHGLQRHVRARRQRTAFDASVQLFDALQHSGGIDIAGHDEDGVVRRVPVLVERLEHRARRRLERFARAQRIVRVRRAGKQVFVQARQELVGRLRQIARDFLLDRAFLLFPLGLRIVDILHARGVEAKRDVEVGGRHRREVLRDVLLRVGVAEAAKLREDRGGLIGRYARAPSERHVLLRVRHPREAGRRLVRADEIVALDRHDRGQPIANDHDSETVIERRTDDVWLRDRGLTSARRRGRQHEQ